MFGYIVPEALRKIKQRGTILLTELLSSKWVSGQNESFPPPHIISHASKHVLHNGSVTPSGATQPLGHSGLPAELKIISVKSKLTHLIPTPQTRV